MRRVQQRERVLIAAHCLHEDRKLTHRLCLVQHRAGAHGELDCRAQPRLAQRGPAGVAVHHPDDLVGFGLIGAGIELIEDRQRGFGHAARLVVALAHEMRLRMVHEAHPLQIHVPGTLRDLEALAEVAVRPVVLPQVRMGDAKIDVRRSGAVLVVRGAIGRDRALVVPHGIDQLTSDVRENAEVLLDAGEQLARLAAAVERLKELGARLFQRAGPQRQPTHRVQRFGGEDVVAERASDFIAAVAQVARSGGFVAMMEDDGEPPQRLGENRLLTSPLGGGDRGFVIVHGFRDARGALATARFVQQVRRATLQRETTHHATT